MNLSPAFSEIFKQSDDFFTILGFDTGTVNLGVAAMRIGIQTLEIQSVDAFTLNALKPAGFKMFDKWMLETHSERAVRIRELSLMTNNLFDEYRPLFLCAESSFINLSNPSAYGPLMETLKAIEIAAFNWNPWRPFYRIETSVAKKSVMPTDPVVLAAYKVLAASRLPNGKKTGAKEKVKFCVDHHPELAKFINTSIVDEHAIDAGVVCYAQLTRIREGNFSFQN